MALDSDNPPASVPQAQTKSFASARVETRDGNFTVMEWWFAWQAPEACYVVAQVHVIINPETGTDLEDFTLWINRPARGCNVVTREPRGNSEGITIGGNLSGPASAGVSAGTTVGVDGTWVDRSRARAGNVTWEIDIDDTSGTASDGAELDFFVQWSCPDCRDHKSLIEEGQRGTDLRVEFDAPGFSDPNYYWNHVDPGRVRRWLPGSGDTPVFGFPAEMLDEAGESLVDGNAEVTTDP